MTPENEKEFLNACTYVYQRVLGGSPPPPIISSVDLTRCSDSDYEAHSDYLGFPSIPFSIYHTGDPWRRPTGPEAYGVRKEAKPICIHPIATVWHKLGRQVYEYFDSVGLKWTSIDPVRFAEFGEEAGPLFLWVGVMPKTLSRKDAKDAAVRCKQILAESQIADVEIAFRESVFTRSAGPQLLNHVSFEFNPDPTDDVRGPLTPAIGLGIAPIAYPHIEGTGGLYLREGDERNQVLLLTPRHVVLPPSKYPNELYTRQTNRSPRREVILLGSKAYQNVLKSIMSKIGDNIFTVDYYKHVLDDLGEAVEGKAVANKAKMEEAEESIMTLNEFYDKITKFWSVEYLRILGHVLHAPPISAGTGDKPFTEDWALVELCDEKINWKDFKGNAIYLGPIENYLSKIYPHTRSGASSSEYPFDGFLQLQGVVKEYELRNPTRLDANGENCLMVVKSGNTTGLTVGRATGIESFVREYDDHDGIHSTSMELAIYSCSYKDGAFSAPGDSGSVIADPNGRIVGIITGGAGRANSTDVTYASPYHWIEESIKKAFPDSYFYPITA